MATEKITKLSALRLLAQELNGQIPRSVSQLSNDSKFQTEEQVAATVNAKVSSTYKAGGSTPFADLPELTEANLGLVVNVTDKFTTTDSFVEGAGKRHPAGTNVAVVQSGEEFKYDVLAGFVDLSGYMEKEEGKVLSANDYTDEDKAKLDSLEFASDEEVTAMLAEVFSAAAS